MNMKRIISFVLTITVVATLFGGCDNFVESNTATKDLQASVEDWQPIGNEYDAPKYLDGFHYPKVRNLVAASSEVGTVNCVQEMDELGRYYPYSFSLYEEGSNEREFYRRLFSAVYSMTSDMYIQDLSLDSDTVNNIFKQVVLEVPEFYYLDTTFKYDLTPNYAVSHIHLNYTLSEEEVTSYNSELFNITQSVKSVLPSNISRYDLYVWLHDFVVLNVEYSDTDGTDKFERDIIGAFIEHKGNCQAFAAAFEFLCRQFNITTCLVTGEVGLPHIWNIVPYGTDWCHIDVGMDNVDSETAPDYVNHNFVMVSDNWITGVAKHNIYEDTANDQLYELPACSNDALSYLTISKGVVNSTDVNELKLQITELLVTQLQSEVPFVELQASTDEVYTVLEEVVLNPSKGHLWDIVDTVSEDKRVSTAVDIKNAGCNFEKWNRSVVLYLLFEDA